MVSPIFYMKRILVAEDDFVVTNLYQLHFRQHGFHGNFFTTGREAIESARQERPDLVLLDFELPDISGPEVMRAIHRLPGCEEVPIIFVTSRATPEVMEDLCKQGARKVFGKPFPPEELLGLIGELLGSAVE